MTVIPAKATIVFTLVAVANAMSIILINLDNSAIPAKAGTHGCPSTRVSGNRHAEGWVPAFAGMTANSFVFQIDDQCPEQAQHV